MRILLPLLLLALVMLAVDPIRVLAQPASAADKTKVAKQYVDAGLAAQSTGDYDTALTMYSNAYQLVQHSPLIFNMAQAHRLAGHIEQALTLYERYLSEEPNGAQAQISRELVAELKARKAEARAKTVEAEEEDQPDSGGKRAAQWSRKQPIDDNVAGGTLIVKVRNPSGVAIDDGRVMVDEDRKGNLAGGKLTVPRIAEGHHTVAIEASGYQRFEQAVTVHDGEQVRLDALLVEKAAPSPSSERTIWKVSLGTSLAVVVSGGAFAVYSYSRVNAYLEPSRLMITGDPSASLSADDCGKSNGEILADHPGITSFNHDALQKACTWRSRVYIGYGVASLGAVGAVVSLIMLTRNPGPSEMPAPRARSKKPEAALLPIVTPSGGGASLSLSW
jgi:hypothetical protein